eukprot:scaffold95258_cov75-Phaeocystis_antarctica.AAC.1
MAAHRHAATPERTATSVCAATFEQAAVPSRGGSGTRAPPVAARAAPRAPVAAREAAARAAARCTRSFRTPRLQRSRRPPRRAGRVARSPCLPQAPPPPLAEHPSVSRRLRLHPLLLLQRRQHQESDRRWARAGRAHIRCRRRSQHSLRLASDRPRAALRGRRSATPRGRARFRRFARQAVGSNPPGPPAPARKAAWHSALRPAAPHAPCTR